MIRPDTVVHVEHSATYPGFMDDLVLTASDDHIARIAHESDPLRAIVELIWNAVDAEADLVDIVLERDDSQAIRLIRVTDDGHGISSDELDSTFGRIGGSWKARHATSKNRKRRLHGKLGEGRLRAFALGSRVRWTSVSDDTAGRREQITISGSRGDRERFPREVRASTESSTGTIFEAHNDEQRSLGALEPERAVAVLRSHFAPLLLNDSSLMIIYDGTALDPLKEISHDEERTFSFGAGDSERASVRIIEWRTGDHRAVYFGPDDDHFPFETSGTDFESQLPFCAYVTWPDLDAERLASLQLGDLAPEEVGELWAATRRELREHFAVRRRQRRREQIEKWKETQIYPYKGEPKTDVERAERAVFDVVSGTLVPHIPKTKAQAQLTLELLKDAIHHDPGKLTTILHEVVALSDADRDALARLLAETTLSAVIRAADLVAGRHKFLAALDHLLFDPLDSGQVGERDHLHRMLEHELWIFGEAYHLMSSERSLTDLLRTHLKLEGLPARDVDTVRRWDGRTGRTDLHLAVRSKEHDRIRHLIVELKAPGITASRKELDQIEDYADAILSTPAFASDKTTWEIILVVTDYNDMVKRRLKKREDGLGLFHAPEPEPDRPLVRGYVRRWRDVINENRQRLDFMTSALQHDPSIAEGIAYVREQYRDLLPLSLQEDPADVPVDEAEADEPADAAMA